MYRPLRRTGQRAIGLRHQIFEARARPIGPKRCNECGFACRGILAGSLAERLRVALHVEQIIRDLEGLADRGAIAIDVGARGGVGLSENCAGATGETDQRAGFHRLQRGDFVFTQATLRLEATFGGEIEHLPSRHAAETGCARQLGNERNSYGWIGMHVRSCHDVEGQRKKCVADEDCRCLVEGFVYRRSPAPQIVIVHGRQIVVDQRIAMHKLERGAGYQCA